MGRFIPPSIMGSWGRRSCSHPSLALPRCALVRSHALPQGEHPSLSSKANFHSAEQHAHEVADAEPRNVSRPRSSLSLTPFMAELPDSPDSPTRLPFFEFLLNLLHQAFKAFTPPKLLLPRSRAFCWVQRVVSLS